jgi:hypothetical protein
MPRSAAQIRLSGPLTLSCPHPTNTLPIARLRTHLTHLHLRFPHRRSCSHKTTSERLPNLPNSDRLPLSLFRLPPSTTNRLSPKPPINPNLKEHRLKNILGNGEDSLLALRQPIKRILGSKQRPRMGLMAISWAPLTFTLRNDPRAYHLRPKGRQC